jgi:hypothetical protein
VLCTLAQCCGQSVNAGRAVQLSTSAEPSALRDGQLDLALVREHCAGPEFDSATHLGVWPASRADRDVGYLITAFEEPPNP